MLESLAGVPELQRKILFYCLGTHSATAMRQIVEKVEVKRCAIPERLIDYITAWRYSGVLGPPPNMCSALKRARAYTFTTFIVGKELEIAKELFVTDGSCARLAAAKKDYEESKEVKFTSLISKMTAIEKNGTPSALLIRRSLERAKTHGLTVLEFETFWSMRTRDGVVRNRGGIRMVESECPIDVLLELTNAALIHKEIRATSEYW